MDKSDSKTKLTGSLILFITGLIWGFHHIVVRASLENFTTHQVQLYEYFIAAITLLIVFRKKLKFITKKEVIHGSIIGLVVFLGQMLQIYATGMTTVSKMSFITVLYVVTVPLIAWIFFKKRISACNIIAVILSVSGLYLLTEATGGINKGDILAFISSLCFAAQIFIIDKWVVDDDEEILAFIQMSSSAIFSLIAILISGEPIILTGTTALTWLGFAYIGMLSCALGFYLQIAGQKRVSPQLCSILLTTEAPAATIFAAIIFGEAITLKSGIGCGLMLIAMIVAQF